MRLSHNLSWRSTVARPMVTLILVGALAACDSGPTEPDDDPWTDVAVESFGLEGRWVWTLATDQERIYAGTREGLYARGLEGEAGEWVPLGLEGRRINAILPGPGGSLLVAVEPAEGDSVSLYRSGDGGETWESDQRGFGGDTGAHEVAALERLPDGALLAGGGAPVVARLEEGDNTWTSVWNEWDVVGLGTHFVTSDPSNSSTVWAGGELGAFNPFLVRSEDGGESWHPVDIDDEAGDNAINALTIHPETSDVVFTGWEGRVEVTRDGGRSWQTVLEPESYPYFRGLAVSPTTPRRVFAAGARNDPEVQDLVFWWSQDEGRTWSSIREEGAGGVLSMRVTVDEKIFLGTQNGIYRVVPE